MENNYGNLLLCNKIKLLPEQLVLENNVLIDSSEPVAKILAASSDVDLDCPVEVLKGECNVSGKVIINIVYLTEAGEINNQTSVSSFSKKLTNDNFDLSSKVCLNVCALSTNLDKNSGNKVKVITTLNFEGTLVKNMEKEYLMDASPNVFVKQAESDVTTFKGQSCDKFEESLDATLKTGVKKVLMTNANLMVKEWSSGTNFVCVEGEIYVKVLYVTGGEVSELETINLQKSFKQEIECEGITKETEIDLSASVINEKVMVELEQLENDETKINVTVPILVCCNSYENSKILTVVDAYSSVSSLALQSEDMNCTKFLLPELIESKIEGNVVLSDSEPRIDKYIATTNVKSTVSNTYVDGGVLTVEGVASANILYLNDELGSIQSVEIEIPFVVDKKVDYNSNVLLEPFVILCDVDVMVKRGREIYFDALVKAFVIVSKKDNLCMVTSLEEKEELAQETSAIEVYFAKSGDSIWDIAKSLHVPSQLILEQNQTLTDPLEKDENITIYFQKQRKNS